MALICYLTLLALVVPAIIQGAEEQTAPNDYCMQCSQRRNHKDMYPDPFGDCHSFYKCLYVNETSALGYKMSCPPGTFWHDEILQCMPEGPVPCQDVCQNPLVAYKGCYPIPGNCLTFVRCATTTSYGFCCPQGTSFNADSCQCDADPVCNDPCLLPPPPVTTETPPVVFDTYCIDSFGNRLEQTAEPSVFLIVADPTDSTRSYRLPCAVGTFFNLATCRCEGEVVAQSIPRSRQCSIYLPLDDDASDNSINKFFTDVVGNGRIDRDISARGAGSIIFDQGGHVEIPGAKTLDFVDQVSVCFYFRCPPTAPCTGGLFSNNKDDQMSEFGLIITKLQNDQILALGSLDVGSGAVAFNLNASTNTLGYNFTQVCAVLDGQEGKLYINNVLQGSVPISGQIKIAHCPVTLGSDQRFGDFPGYLDELLVCPFGLTADEVEAHWAGRVSMEIAGLVPPKQGLSLPQYDEIAPQPSPTGCGHNKYWNSGENYKTSLQIVGGVSGREHEFPWYTVLAATDSTGATRLLNANLINANWLITEARLLRDDDSTLQYTAFFGQDGKLPNANPTVADLQAMYSVSRKVNKIIVHPLYNSTTLDNNFVLAQFSPSVPLDTWNIQPICLPQSCADTCQTDERATIFGYGQMSERFVDLKFINTVRKATVAVVDHNLCKQLYTPFEANQVWVTDTMVCASNNWRYSGVDTCIGDDGAGLLCYKKGYFTLDGVVGYGKGCAEPRFPGIYAQVCSALNWIQQTTSN